MIYLLNFRKKFIFFLKFDVKVINNYKILIYNIEKIDFKKYFNIIV